jgi:two-component system, OmpR family, phosphate regulon sensor histidine kinase PhoR
MSPERRQILLVTLVVIAIFGVYEIAKTLLFPDMDVNTSHVVSTVVVGLLTLIAARFVIFKQSELLNERERSNERLREALAQAERSGNLLRSIVESVAEGLVITDREANLLLVNDAARQLLDLGERSVTRLTEVSRDREMHRAFAQVLAQGERAEARLEMREAGTLNRRVLRLHAAPLYLHDDQIDGVVCALIDISKLERLEQVRQEFLSNVSHELRTPLAAITAYSETLLDGGLDDEENALRFLHTIHRNAARMSDLVSDIAELSAIESGNVRLQIEPLPIQRIVAETFAHLAPRAEQQQVTLANEVPEDIVVTADRRRLEQILINLIDNAIKFNKPGGDVTVNLELSPRENFHLLSVSDTGTGIPAEDLSRVFERFYRVDKARSRAIGGTGLGLAIVKHLAIAHGGEASVASEISKGTTFTIKLPTRAITSEAVNETVDEAKAALPTSV